MVGRILTKLMARGVVTPVPMLRRKPGPRRLRILGQRHAKRLPKGMKPIRPGELVQIDTLFVNVAPDKAVKHFTAYDPVAKWTVALARRRNGSIRGSVRDVLSDELLSDCPAYRANPYGSEPTHDDDPGAEIQLWLGLPLRQPRSSVMPEANQYTFTHKELTEMLVRQAGLHEGRWMPMLTLGFGPGNFGPSESEVVPGAIVTITNVGIQKAPAESPSSLDCGRRCR